MKDDIYGYLPLGGEAAKSEQPNGDPNLYWCYAGQFGLDGEFMPLTKRGIGKDTHVR